MAEEVITRSKTVEDIFSTVQPESRKVLQELFAELHPGLANYSREISSIFSAQSAETFLSQITDISELLNIEDSYEQTVRKLQDRITEAESIRDAVLAKLFDEIRPLEESYRNLFLFFENSRVPSAATQRPVEMYVFNADSCAMKDLTSTSLVALQETLAEHNDIFNFREAICNLVIPGFMNQQVRDRLEQEAEKFGMLLISDLHDEKHYKDVVRQFRTQGEYQFLKRQETQASAHVVLVGWLRTREKHYFENISGDDGLYVPPSVAFAGAIARTDEAVGMRQGPIGTRFGQIVGADKCRIEPRISQMEDLSMEKQVIPIIRDANNRLCFYGCRSLVEDPYGVYKFFTSYRILRIIERSAAATLREVAGMTLNRDMVDETVDKPLKMFLQQLKDEGTLLDFKLSIDRDFAKLSQGICDITLEVLPVGPAETFVLRIDVPEAKPAEKK